MGPLLGPHARTDRTRDRKLYSDFNTVCLLCPSCCLLLV